MKRALAFMGLLALATPLLAYPAAPGFDESGSDPRAVAIADEVMAALGGYEAWQETRYLTWRFFGGRRHLWDKWTGDLRFEEGDLLVLMNLGDRRGRAFRGGRPLSAPDSLQAALERAYRAWINDSYWLLMPYKLKDSGVTLGYGGKGRMQDGRAADVLVLTFAGVGVTPENKYEVWVDEETHLVGQWAYYPRAADAEPRFVAPWRNWRRYGQILLSDDRGERALGDIAVLADVPASAFDSPAPIEPLQWAR